MFEEAVYNAGAPQSLWGSHGPPLRWLLGVTPLLLQIGALCWLCAWRHRGLQLERGLEGNYADGASAPSRSQPVLVEHGVVELVEQTTGVPVLPPTAAAISRVPGPPLDLPP